MPGFILHLAQAMKIMEHMEETPGELWRQEFLLGNLLPDTRLGEEKGLSHFWGEGQEDFIARAPQLSLFLNKYGHRLKEPAVLGYYAHLFLDTRYVREFWPKTISFEDREGKPEGRKARIIQVKRIDTGEKIPFESFFSAEYYYGDYTRSNHWVAERFHIEPPKYKSLEGLGIEESHPEELRGILKELEILFEAGRPGDETGMKVFKLKELEAFVVHTAEAFCGHIERLSII